MTRTEDVMIDLETMGTDSDAPIMSIGAVFFDRFTGTLGQEFHQRIDLKSNMDQGRIPSASTIEWWLSQSKQAQKELMDGHKENLKNGLYALTAWMHTVNPQSSAIRPWANGLNFDITILEDAYNSFNGDIRFPWKFWNLRDVRTAYQLGNDIGIDPKSVKFVGTAHNALSDAKHQAKIVGAIWGASTAMYRS